MWVAVLTARRFLTGEQRWTLRGIFGLLAAAGVLWGIGAAFGAATVFFALCGWGILKLAYAFGLSFGIRTTAEDWEGFGRTESPRGRKDLKLDGMWPEA